MTLLAKGLLSVFLIGSSGGIVAGSYLWNNFSSSKKKKKAQRQQKDDVTSGEEGRKSKNTPNSLEPEPTSEDQTSTNIEGNLRRDT